MDDRSAEPQSVAFPAVFALVIALLAPFAGACRAEPKPQANLVAQTVPGDRWLEIDLYWFDKSAIERSAQTFWDRYAPLYQGVQGYRGVVLSVGLTVGYIMDFSGDPDQQIVLPKGEGQELGVDIKGPLLGDTEQRQVAWRRRFAAPANTTSQIGYGHWTYRQLAEVVRQLKIEAVRHGVSDFKVAGFAAAPDSAYSEPDPFAQRHPEAWTHWGPTLNAFATHDYFDPAAVLKADAFRYAAFPDGMPRGLAVHAAFAAQWGAVSKAVGLDGILLRDAFGFPRPYSREGPFGVTAPDPQTIRAMTDGVSALVHETKRANPNALVMMWSSAATATSDWRANGLDLERIAKEGDLDIFIDQTWAGAWNEVGVRQTGFWNAPLLGWTYQLGYMLEHSAVLAGTRVRHYPLVETYDAWESWDTLHTAPDRLRWGVWAYSHAAVKTPTGLQIPNGSYVSWANHGHSLLSEVDVAFLAKTMNAAARDAAAMTEVYGPTVVYSREAMKYQAEHIAPELDARDQIDEQVGTIVKWPVPVLSITRMEYLPRVSSDLFVFGATAHAPADQVDAVLTLSGSAQPVAFFGAFDRGVDPAFVRLGGVVTELNKPGIADRILRATFENRPRLPLKNAPAAFDAPPPPAHAAASKQTVVYSFAGSPALVWDKSLSHDVVLWDPPPLAEAWSRSLRYLLNDDPAPYVAAAASLTGQLTGRGALHAAEIDLRQTGAVAAWRTRDGSVHILVGNTEEGLRDDADQTRHVSLTLPRDWRGLNWSADRSGALRLDHGALNVRLGPLQSVLISGSPSAERRRRPRRLLRRP